MTILNYTPHNIVMYDPKDTVADESGRRLYLKEGAQPLFQVQSEGILSAKTVEGELPFIPEGVSPKLLQGPVRFAEVDPFPEIGENDIIVVSNLFRAACVELEIPTRNLATVAKVVHEKDNPKPVGCCKLAIG